MFLCSFRIILLMADYLNNLHKSKLLFEIVPDDIVLIYSTETLRSDSLEAYSSPSSGLSTPDPTRAPT